MSWEDQGRQEHGWFGSGTSANSTQTDTGDGGLFGAGGLGQRIQAVIYGAAAALPAELRRHGAAHPDTATLGRLTDLMSGWARGAKLDQASFAGRFFARAADDPIAAKLRSAAMGASMARSHDELRDAAIDLAAAQQIVGLDRWQRFLADAQQRADDPATVAAVEKSQAPPDVAKDAIRPVYPFEAAIGIAAAALTGGAAAVARSTSGVIVRRILTAGGKPADDALPNASEARIPPEKLTDYALNPEHPLSGADKARVFDTVLGFNKSNATELLTQIKEGVTKNPAIMGKIDEFGQRFTVDIPVTGPKGSAVVRTGWIIDRGSNTPRLVTLFVK